MSSPLISHRVLMAVLVAFLAMNVPDRAAAQDNETQHDETQNNETQAVISTVQTFFHAMTENDLELARSVMRDDGQLYGTSVGEAENSVFKVEHHAYFERMTGEKDHLVEAMYHPEVLIRGPVAILWTAYDFHVNEEFSHCGVDAFTLIKSDGDWKIANTAFTMEKTGCENIHQGF